MAEIRRYGIIFASDETDPDKAYRILDDVEKFIDGIKIGITATVIVGSNLIRRIRKTFDKPVIADFKIADIGFRGICRRKSTSDDQPVASAIGTSGTIACSRRR